MSASERTLLEAKSIPGPEEERKKKKGYQPDGVTKRGETGCREEPGGESYKFDTLCMLFLDSINANACVHAPPTTIYERTLTRCVR